MAEKRGKMRKNEENHELNIYLLDKRFPCLRELPGILDTMPKMWYIHD